MDRSLVQKLRKNNGILRDALKIARNEIKALKREQRELIRELRTSRNAFQDQFNKIGKE